MQILFYTQFKGLQARRNLNINADKSIYANLVDTAKTQSVSRSGGFQPALEDP